MKILVVGFFSSAASLIAKLAKDNPDTSFDFLGIRSNDLEKYRNVNKIEITVEKDDYLNGAINYIIRNFEKYDFIYANDNIFQFSREFQNFKNNCKIPMLCPSEESSLLEKNKIYCKEILTKSQIPTPHFNLIDDENIFLIEEELEKEGAAVLKLNSARISTGHATWIVKNQNYKKWIDSIKRPGYNDLIFLEKFIKGKELSFHILSNGESWIYLGSSRDYKKLYEGDTGINCTSAGCYSPVPHLTEKIFNNISTYVDKIISHEKSKGTPYVGIMYLGILISNDLPYILEINTRPGNPEFTTILPCIESNILPNLINAASNKDLEPLKFNKSHSVAIQILHKDYTWKTPENIVYPNFQKDDKIIMHISEKMRLFDNLRCCLIKTSDNLKSATDYLHNYLEKQDLGTYRYRKDIGILI